MVGADSLCVPFSCASVVSDFAPKLWIKMAPSPSHFVLVNYLQGNKLRLIILEFTLLSAMAVCVVYTYV